MDTVPVAEVQLLMYTMRCAQMMKDKVFNWSLPAAVHTTEVKWSMIFH